MHIRLLQTTLKDAVALVAPVTAPRHTLPILATILVTAADDGITFMATDLNTAIQYRSGGQVDQTGACCVNAKAFKDVVDKLPDDAITLALDGNTLSITAPNVAVTLPTIDADEFPLPPNQQPTTDVPWHVITTIDGQVAIAAADDDVRPVLSGIRLVLDTGVTAVAADGFRLAKLDKELDGETIPAIRALVPARSWRVAASAIKKLKLDADDIVRLGAAPEPEGVFDKAGAFVFATPAVTIWTRLIDGKYPDVERVLTSASGHTTRAVLDTADVRNALDLANVFAKNSSNIVKLDVADMPDGGRMLVNANANGTGSGSVMVRGIVSGPDTTIAVNVGYLRDAIDAIDTPEVALALSGPDRPLLVTPVGDDGYQHVLMPMTVR